MKLGGNANAKEFFALYNIPNVPDLSRKYSHLAACAYRDRIDTLSDGRPWENPSQEGLKKYASLNMGFSLPAALSTSSPKQQPRNDPAGRGRSSPTARSSYSDGENYSKYNGSTAISSDDFFGRANPLSTTQTGFRYHDSSNFYSTQSRGTSGGLSPGKSLLGGSEGNDRWNGLGGSPIAQGRGAARARGRARGRGRGPRGQYPRTGRGGGTRGPAARADSEDAISVNLADSLEGEEHVTEESGGGGIEDLNDDGWGGELTNDGWGSELSNDVKNLEISNSEKEPAESGFPAVDIWNFSASTSKDAAPSEVQPTPTDVSC